MVLSLLAGLALFAAILQTGYHYRDWIEANPGQAKAVGIAIAVAAMIVVVVAGHYGLRLYARIDPTTIHLRVRAKRQQKQAIAEHEARLTAMEADPALRVYALRMRAGGEYWTDAQIAYDLDKTKTECCRHLAPIEQAMRASGLRVRPIAERHVDARCTINEGWLRTLLAVPVDVTYSPDIFAAMRDANGYTRAADDVPNAELRCVACNSAIHMPGPHEAKPGTPIFPQPPTSPVELVR